MPVAALAGTVRILPPLPGSIHELLTLNLRDKDLPESVHDVIELDPPLAAYVVRGWRTPPRSGARRRSTPSVPRSPASERR